jgi:hypothetical protein
VHEQANRKLIKVAAPFAIHFLKRQNSDF